MLKYLDVSQRRLEPEVMDDPDLEPEQHVNALRGLAQLNRISRAAAGVVTPLLRWARQHGARELSLLDVATGGADVPLEAARLAAKRGVRLNLSACDISPRALELALRRAEQRGVELNTFQLHAVDQAPPERYDVITCSLFLHHLRCDEVVRLIRNLAQSTRRLMILHDLRRTRRGLAMAWLASRVFTRSPVVHTDAVLSARAAYTVGELKELAQQAGLRNARITPCWPSRLLLTWDPSA